MPRPEIRTEFLFDLEVDLKAPDDLGVTPQGNRLIAIATGGAFAGPRLQGEVLGGGGDWLIRTPRGTGNLDVRITLRTHDGALIYMTYGGRVALSDSLLARMQAGDVLDPSTYYFRTAPYFETAAEPYAWLNDLIAVGIGRIINQDGRNGVGYTVYAIL